MEENAVLTLRKYIAPDFSLDKFMKAPDARFETVEIDGGRSGKLSRYEHLS